MNLNYGEMMSILKKIKLALLASAVMLSPQGAYAVDPNAEDLRGYRPLANLRETPFEGEKTRGVASSSRAVDQEIQETTFIPRISKDKLEDISAKMSTNGATLKFLEAKILGSLNTKKTLRKTVEIPKTTPQSPRSPQSPRKKGKPNGDMGAEESFQISAPAPTMEKETLENFEESLPALFLKFSERYIILRQEITEEELGTFNQLYSSFLDVIKLYKDFYSDFNLYPGIVPKDSQEDSKEDSKRHQSYMALAKIYQRYFPDFEYIPSNRQREHLKRGRSKTLSILPGCTQRSAKSTESIGDPKRSFASLLIEESEIYRKKRDSLGKGSSLLPFSPSPSQPLQSSRESFSSPQSPPLSSPLSSSLSSSPVPSRFMNGVSLPSLSRHSPRPSRSSEQSFLPPQSSVALLGLKSDGPLSPLSPPLRNGTSLSSQALCVPSGSSEELATTAPESTPNPESIDPKKSFAFALRKEFERRNSLGKGSSLLSPRSSEELATTAPQSPTVPPRSSESATPSSSPVSPPPSRPLQKISSPPLSTRSLQGASAHQSSPALWVPSGFSGESVVHSKFPPVPPRTPKISSSPVPLSLKNNRPLPLSPQLRRPLPQPSQPSEEIAPAPQSPSVSPPTQRPSRPLPLPPESLGKTPAIPVTPAPPVAPRPRHRSLSVIPQKATFNSLSPAEVSSGSKDDKR